MFYYFPDVRLLQSFGNEWNPRDSVPEVIALASETTLVKYSSDLIR